MNTVCSTIPTYAESSSAVSTLENSLANFLTAENARTGDGPPLLPALHPLDWGRLPAEMLSVPLDERVADESSTASESNRPVWPAVAAALFIGAGVGTCFGLMVAMRM